MSRSPAPRWVVFTDLDGTLLDHDSYDPTPALPALERLRALQIPVVPVTSKTLAEIDEWRERLGLQQAAVAENGGVLALPGEAPRITPPGYARIRAFLQRFRTHPGRALTGFGDMDDEQVAEATGLTRAAAHRARQRLASEPFLWQGDAAGLEALRLEVADAGLRLLRGGRFWHLLGDTDKGRALRSVAGWYRRRWGTPVTTVALGDSPNDLAMLEAADRPVVIRHKDGGALQIDARPEALLPELPGPAGWRQGILALLASRGD